MRCVPGSLVELEDEKQLRILNELFVPLSQAMPAMAAVQDQQMLQQATKTMQYIIAKQIELSGSTSAKDLGLIWNDGDVEQVNERDAKIAALEEQLTNAAMERELEGELNAQAIAQLQEQMRLMAENQGLLLEKLGVTNGASAPTPNSAGAPDGGSGGTPPSVTPVIA